MADRKKYILYLFQCTCDQNGSMDLDWLWLIIPGSYIIISTIFLCFPCCRHRYRHPVLNQLLKGQKLISIGHRGGGFEGPENTLQLFKKTQKVLHMFELDIHQTRDKQLVVHHDASLQRTTGLRRQLKELNYEELPPLLPEIQIFGLPGEMMTTQNNKIMLLDTLFREYPHTLMNIDLKSPTQSAAKEFARLVKLHHREHNTIWGAISDDGRQLLQKQNPDVPTFYSTWQILKVFLLCISGLLPFWPLREGVLDIPLLTEGMKNMTGTAAKSCGRKVLLCIAVSLLRFFNFISRLFVPHLRKRGILTFYWIVNEEQGWDKAVSIGCQGVMTDCPSNFSAYLKEKGIYFEDESIPDRSYEPVNPDG